MFDGFMFDETLKKCKDFATVGCGRTPNGFLTEEECENSCGKYDKILTSLKYKLLGSLVLLK